MESYKELRNIALVGNNIPLLMKQAIENYDKYCECLKKETNACKNLTQASIAKIGEIFGKRSIIHNDPVALKTKGYSAPSTYFKFIANF